MFLTILLIISTLVTDTTSTEVSFSRHAGPSTYALEGERHGGFAIRAQSVYDIDSVHRVFGEASYTWDQSQENKYIENADYRLLYPYLTTDTVGGGMRTEQYWFRGGYRMHKRNWVWHIAMQFRAQQSYRAVDPRPKNKVTDLRVEASVGYAYKGYAWLFMAQGGRYKQSNELKFYSELGENQIYHMVGTGAAYTRFSGNKKESYYNGYTAGLSLAMLPFREGWIASIDYGYLGVDKEIHDNTFIPLGRLRSHALEATFGYITLLWRVTAQAGWSRRLGQQYIYGEAANNTYRLLTMQSNYREDKWHVGASGSYRLNLPVGYMRFAGALSYQQSALSTLPVEVRWTELHALLTDSEVQAALSVRYAFPIKGRFAWFFEPAADLHHYTKTTRQTWQVVFQTGLVF